MSNYMALLNASDGVLLDISGFVGGRSPDPEFPTPQRMATRSETFIAAGQYVGSIHDSVRSIVVPIVVGGGLNGVASTSLAVETKWTEIVATLNVAAGLAVQLDGLAAQTIYTLLRAANGKAVSTAERFVDSNAARQLVVFGQLNIEAQPYTRNGSLSAFTPFES